MAAFFSHNGHILPSEAATVSLASVEYAYGFGVYETIRLTKGTLYFVEDHCQRLMQSAEIIGLEHHYTSEFVQQSITALTSKNNIESCNIKILLIGGRSPESADLYIQCLNPLFPDRKLYKQGTHCVTEQYERAYPQAKTLNMLPSYLAYRKARQTDAYDALLINRAGNITEGTRTNFYVLQGRTIISPPAAEILLGVTRDKVLAVAKSQGFSVIEQDIPLDTIANYDGAFLTSTSTKIMPIRSIDDFTWPEIPAATYELIKAFNAFLDA